MIIKLIPIKTKTRLSAVVQYIATDKGRIQDHTKQGIFHNIKSRDLKNIQDEFENNYDEYASKRKNGNIALHGIVSHHPGESENIDVETMDDITNTLLQKAYPQALSFGTHHVSENHRHSHFIVSANALMSNTSTRLSRQRLFELHKEMLEFVKEKYPEIKTRIDISQWGRKLNNEKDYYMKKRNPDLKLSKEELKEKINEILSFCRSSKSFFAMLEFEGFKTYSRNDKVQGILFGEHEQKIRLSRLGIEQEHLDEMDKWNERLEELGKTNPNVKEAILEDYLYKQTNKEIYEQIEKYEAEQRLKELGVKDDHLMIDHYTYDFTNMSGSPTGVNPDLVYDNDLETKTEEQELDEEFFSIMSLPVQEEKATESLSELDEARNVNHEHETLSEKNGSYDPFLNEEEFSVPDIEKNEEYWRDFAEFDGKNKLIEIMNEGKETEIESDSLEADIQDDSPASEPEQNENDINDLENETENDIDADNDMDMDSEP